MRTLRPVDLVVDLDVPESGWFTDETMTGPAWNTVGVCWTFFGQPSRYWLIDHEREGHLVLDGQALRVPRRLGNAARYWRLVDVERLAHALAQNGYLPLDQLVRVLTQLRLIAESWGFIDAAPVPMRTEEHQPYRHRGGEVAIVVDEPSTTDDLDGAQDAAERRFSLAGVHYTIDLTEEHWLDLVAALAPYVRMAKRDGGQRWARPQLDDQRAIRDWAKEHGHTVAPTGPISQVVLRAYAHRDPG